MKRILAGILAVAVGPVFAQTPPVKVQTPDVKVPPPLILPPPKEVVTGQAPLGLSEAVDIALARQPAIGIAQGSLLSAEGRVRQTQSGLYPTLSATSGYSKQSVIRGSSGGSSSGGGTATNAFNSTVNVNQLLFDFGRTRDEVRQQTALARASRQTLLRTQQTVALSVKQSYYSLVQARQFVTISEENVANRQRQYDQAQARLNAGLGAPSDVVNAKTALADAVLSLTAARSDELSSQIDLDLALGIDPRTPITLAPASEPAVDAESDLQRLVETAINQRPDVRAARERVSAATFGVSAASKGELPRVSASAGFGARGPNDPLQTETVNVGIQVSWSFSTGGLTAGQVQEARGSQLVARNELIQTSQQAVSDVSQAYVDLQAAIQRLETAQVQLANAREFVRIAEGRYAGGIGTFLEVTTAQNSLFAAQRNVAQAQQDVERARARLRTAVGQS